jgi:membrane associated rhomboid family serine protease
MRLLDRLERKVPWLGIPGLLTIVAGLQVLVFILTVIRGPENAEAFLSFLSLNPVKALDGEVWRIFSYIFIPQSTSVIFVIFGFLVLNVTGRYLEDAIGAFKLTVFFLATVLLIPKPHHLR